MTKVYWTPFYNGPMHDSLVLFQEPDSFLKEIRSRGDLDYLKCYAFLDFAKNTFIMRAPYDIEVMWDREKGIANISQNQDVFDHLCFFRGGNLVSLPPRYLFYSDEDVTIEVMPALLQKPSNYNVVPGTYNIGKWIRPLDFTFELVDDKPVTIKAGDPLLNMRFRTKDDSGIVFERVELTEELRQIASGCSGVKERQKGIPLPALYEKASSLIQSFMGRNHGKSKCPFGFRK